MRPLGIPTFKDKLVQEVVKEILESIYEPVFSDSSHGFRPGRGCHSALNSIQYGCKGATWVIEGDITSFFDNIDHDVLLDLISKKVDDGRVIELIRRFLKAGYIEDCSFKESELGSPQGGVLSPLLANIYLNELDKFVEGLKTEYERGSKRRSNPEYEKLNSRRKRAIASGRTEDAEALSKEMKHTPTKDAMDDGFIRVKYVRYADDWCVFIIGSKALAMEIKDRIEAFLRDSLHLELSPTKTHVTNLAHERIRFLGYEIHKLTREDGIRRSGCISFSVPADVIRKRISDCTKNGKPCARDDLVNRSVEEIIGKYASEMNGLYNYYSLASNVSGRLYRLVWYHRGSLLKTIAKKERSSVRKVLRKYRREVRRPDGRGTTRTVCVMDGDKMVAYYPVAGFRKKQYRPKPEPDGIKELGPKLKERILSCTCEVCGCKGPVEVHHIRSLKQTVEKYEGKRMPYWVSLMQNMRSKTLVLCKGCHRKLHSEKLVSFQGPLESPMH